MATRKKENRATTTAAPQRSRLAQNVDPQRSESKTMLISLIIARKKKTAANSKWRSEGWTGFISEFDVYTPHDSFQPSLLY